jgi:mannose-6-phosphate isomerase
VWFTFEENATSLGISLGELLRKHPEVLGSAADPRHPGVCPLLLKLLFTTERLSVQVHPDDEYAERQHSSPGKTEAWYVVDAEPKAEVAVGFREPLSPERLKQSAETGEIERLLAWHQVNTGDVVFVPAGTVHAIGAGVTICEVQENSDITYRLYDYGRPRELHLEQGMAVSNLEPYRWEPNARQIGDGRELLTECKYFRMERLRPKRGVMLQAELPYYLLLICVHGEGMLEGSAFSPGQAWFVPAGGEQFTIKGAGSEWILTYTAEEPLTKIGID